MSRIADPGAPGGPCIRVLAPTGADDLDAQVSSCSHLAADEEVIVDLRRIEAIDPPLLRALHTLATQGRPGRVALTGVTPEVYKALHVAGVASLFRRA